MKYVKKSPSTSSSSCPPSTASQVKRYVLQGPPDHLVLEVHEDSVAGGDQRGPREIRELRASWGHRGKPGNQEWQDLLGREEKRETLVPLDREACRDHLVDLENQYPPRTWHYHLLIRLEMKEEAQLFIVRLEEILHQQSNGDSREGS